MSKGGYVYEYPRPAVTVDAVVFTMREGRREVLLIERKHAPFAGTWALPGGFVEMEEPLEAAALRELEEETGVTGVTLAQLGAFGDPNRDPRGRTIAVAFWGETDWRQHAPEGGDDAAKAAWFPVDALPPLAFDHGEMVQLALGRAQTS
jgi:8-oxo-dGTP diphosphatase